MSNSKILTGALLLVWVSIAASRPVVAAVRGDAAKYVGGTAQLEDNTKGKLNYDDASALIFNSKKGSLKIPYATVESIEYGQKVGRRVGAAIVVSPVLLFSKKRKHYLTVNYKDAGGAEQGVVFEIGKKQVRNALTTLETKSGKKVEFESEEARKHAGY